MLNAFWRERSFLALSLFFFLLFSFSSFGKSDEIVLVFDNPKFGLGGRRQINDEDEDENDNDVPVQD